MKIKIQTMKMTRMRAATASPNRMANNLPLVKIKAKAMTANQWMMLVTLVRLKMAKWWIPKARMTAAAMASHPIQI